MLKSSKVNNTNNSSQMGAIDPIIARNHVKLKSASIEASNQSSSSLSTPFNYGAYDSISTIESVLDKEPIKDNNNDNYDNKTSKQTENLEVNNKKSSTLSPCSGGSPLKPSVSTSCLAITTKDNQGSTEALVCVPTRASLTHEWKKLKTPNKCRECNLLVYFNGRECSFCGFVAHKKCVTVLVIKCSGQSIGIDNVSRKLKLIVQPIFGQPIVESNQVVDFMRRFIYEIDTRGLTSKGIYRVSSIKSKVDKLCNYFDQNLSSLVDLSSFHPNIIANALKMYLRQLPEPLFTHQFYHHYIELAKKYANLNNNKNDGKKPTKATLTSAASSLESSTFNSDKQQASNKTTKTTSTSLTTPYRQRKPYSMPVSLMSNIPVNNDPSYNPMMIVEIREIMEMLPAINRQLIAIIMRHLKRVHDMSEENQMSAKNLSIIFGPTLLSADNKSLAIVDNIHQARIVELMITWANQIFPQYENYESTAVIELDFSDDERKAQQQQQSSKERKSDKHKSLGGMIIGRKNSGTSKQLKSSSLIKDGSQTKLKNDKPILKHHLLTVDTSDPYEGRPRIDLRELRRQFFTVPVAQTNPDPNPNPSLASSPNPTSNPNQQEQQQQQQSKTQPTSSPSSSSAKIAKPSQVNEQTTPGHGQTKSFNPPGSVPVIKVQPCYCNTLTKYASHRP